MNRSRASLGVVVLAGCLFAVGISPGIASAAASASVPSTGVLVAAPLPKRPPAFDVQLWPEPARSVIVVGAIVPTGTPLPVLVRMPLPAGATVDWVGEILGATAKEDIRSPYRLTDDGRVLEMVLTSSRTAQYEATYVQPTLDGDVSVATLDWTQSTPASTVQFAVKATTAIGTVSVQPPPSHAPQFNDVGERLYVLEPRTMKVGDKASVVVTFRPAGAVDDTGTAQGSGSSPVLVGLSILLAVCVGALIVLIRRQAVSRGRG